MIIKSIGVGVLAFITLFCSATSDKVWFKWAISIVMATLIAILVSQTWI